MSITLTISGESLSEIHTKVVNMAAEVAGQVMQPKIEAASSLKKPDSTPVPITETYVDQVVANTNKINQAPPIVDSRGIPWDARIHSSTKELVKNGVWKRKRGMSDNESYIAQVEAELLGKSAPVAVEQNSNPIQTSAPTAGPMFPMQPIAPMPTAEIKQPMPEAPASIVEIPTPIQSFSTPQVNNAGYTAETFRTNLVNILTNLISSGKLPETWVQENKGMFGGKEVWDWNKDEAVCSQLFDAFVTWGFIQKAG